MNWMKDALGLKISKDEFAEVARKTIIKGGETRDLVYDKEDFCFKVCENTGDIGGVINLHNVYDEYCRIPKGDREVLLQTFFAHQEKMPATLADAITHVIPRVQPRSFFEGLQTSKKISESKKKPGIAHQMSPNTFFAEHFTVSLAFDGPTTISYIPQSILEEWSTSFEELLPRAITNLHRMTPDPFQPLQPGLYVSQYMDTHDASRMLLPERVKECRVNGRPIAVAANRNCLMITGEDDFEKQALLIAAVEKILEDPRPMPPFPLVYENEHWQLWRVPRENPNCAQFDLLNVRASLDIYGTQKALIDQLYDADGTDVFVASFTGYQTTTGEVLSQCVWTQGVHSLLPKTDRIAFVTMKGLTGSGAGDASWEDVAAIVGESLVEEKDMYPSRYRVNSFPSDEQMKLILKK